VVVETAVEIDLHEGGIEIVIGVMMDGEIGMAMEDDDGYPA
jgi:hypothetical protein